MKENRENSTQREVFGIKDLGLHSEIILQKFQKILPGWEIAVKRAKISDGLSHFKFLNLLKARSSLWHITKKLENGYEANIVIDTYTSRSRLVADEERVFFSISSEGKSGIAFGLHNFREVSLDYGLRELTFRNKSGDSYTVRNGKEHELISKGGSAASIET
jgi:hypothetical protein